MPFLFKVFMQKGACQIIFFNVWSHFKQPEPWYMVVFNLSVFQLPGIDTIQTYNFRFGRTPILIAELPLALNPTGCIRSEKFRKHHATR